MPLRGCPRGCRLVPRRVRIAGSVAAVGRRGQVSRRCPRAHQRPAGRPASGQPPGSAWAVNGPRVRGGGSMLAGTAAAPGIFPSGWYQVAVTAPGYNVTGVSLPGLPGSPDRPQQAHRLDADRNAEPVRAVLRGADEPQPPWRLSVARSMAAHAPGPLHHSGPRRHGQAADGRLDQRTARCWPGRAGLARRSRSTGWAAAARRMSRSSPGSAPPPTSRSSTRHWRAGGPRPRPSSMPIVAATSARLPLAVSLSSGAGRLGCRCRVPDDADVAGLIPFAALPVSYDPPGHVVAAAGQRPVDERVPVLPGHVGQ